MARYNAEIRKDRIKELNEKLAGLDDSSDEYLKVLQEITDLQKSSN